MKYSASNSLVSSNSIPNSLPPYPSSTSSSSSSSNSSKLPPPPPSSSSSSNNKKNNENSSFKSSSKYNNKKKYMRTRSRSRSPSRSYRSSSSYNNKKYSNNNHTSYNKYSSYRRNSSPSRHRSTHSPSRSPIRSRSSSSSPAVTSSTSTFDPIFSPSLLPPRSSGYSFLPLEWWEREEKCRDLKLDHVDKIDSLCCTREQLVLYTTLKDSDTMLEENYFPYSTPSCIKHYTLWSIKELKHDEIIEYVDQWLLNKVKEEEIELNNNNNNNNNIIIKKKKKFLWKDIKRWQYDDNSGERSFLLFHVHVFIEIIPYSFIPNDGKEYYPPHCKYIKELYDKSSSF